MAAPVSASRKHYGFRDAKGNTRRMTVVIGGATVSAVDTNRDTLAGHLVSASNAAVWVTENPDPIAGRTYGANAEFPNVEDKALLTFQGPTGYLHRFQVPAPKLACFATDGETVVNSGVMGAVITDFTTFVYGQAEDTAPLTFIGGIRLRKRLSRRLTIFTKDPTLTEPAE